MDYTRLVRSFRIIVNQGVASRRLERLRSKGLSVGEDTFFPDTTVVDEAYCHLVRIGSHCGLGAQVLLLPHDETLANLVGISYVGTIRIHDSTHIGARTIVFPGVEIGPRTVVAACSVVRGTLPPDTFCAGDPARPFATLERYLNTHKRMLQDAAKFPFEPYGQDVLSDQHRAELVAATATTDAYIIGGRTAELRGQGTTPRT